MAVFSILESHFSPENTGQGHKVTEALWHDMRSYAGYLRHTITEDLDDSGHLIVISEWESRAAADQVLTDYADSANARHANELASEPRRRTVGQTLQPNQPKPGGEQ